MKLNFVPRAELKAREWDRQAKLWDRPEIDGPTLQVLNARSALEGGVRIVVHLGLIAATGWLTITALNVNLLFALPPFLAYLWLVGFLNGIEHEMRHKILLPRGLDWLSEALYFVIHVLWKYGSRVQRVSHVIHHRYTMVLGVDPEPAFPENLSTRWVRRELLGILLTLLTLGVIDFVKAMWGLVQRTGGRLAPMIQAQCSAQDLKFIRLESFAILVINVAVLVVCLLFGRWDLILLLMLAPPMGLAVGAFYHRTEHIGMMYDTKDQRLCTRGVKVNPITKFFYGGLDEHVEHHLFAAVPSRNLTKLRQSLSLSIPRRMNVIDCWREIYAIARHKETHPDEVLVPEGV